LVDDQQLSRDTRPSQLRGAAGEQALGLGRRVSEANDEGGQVRHALFDSVARNRQQRSVRHVG
jgi:hypothetical protein